MNRENLERPFDPQQIKQREGSFGDVLDYVEGSVVIERLNEAFDGAWSFEVVEHRVLDDEVIVLGRLTAEGITKSQFGKSKLTRQRSTKIPLSVGDDCKAAATDSLKKCATLFGVGLHLYQDGLGRQPAHSPNGTRPPAPSRNGDRPDDHAAPSAAGEPAGRLTARQLGAIYAIAKRGGRTQAEIKTLTLEVFNKVPDYLSREEASTIITMLQEEAGDAS